MNRTEVQEMRAYVAEDRAEQRIKAKALRAFESGKTAGAAGREPDNPHRKPVLRGAWFRGWSAGRDIYDQRQATRDTPPDEKQRILSRLAEIKRQIK